MLMKELKKHIPSAHGRELTAQHIVKAVCRAIILTAYVSTQTPGSDAARRRHHLSRTD